MSFEDLNISISDPERQRPTLNERSIYLYPLKG